MTRLRPLLISLATAIALAVPATASADFGFLGDWGGTGSADGQFATPTWLDVAPDGSVWVAENDKRVQKFTPDGKYLTRVEVGRFGAGPVATDGGGNVYVGNKDDYRIEKFDASGNHVATFGAGNGEGPGQLRDVCGLAADAAGNVYVADGRNGYCDSPPRIQKFDPNGNLVKEIKLTAKGAPGGVGDLAVDAGGNILVGNSSHFSGSEIYKLSPDGAVVARFGSRGSGPGQFGDGGPESIALAPDGTIYAVDAQNHRIQHLSPDGSFINQFGAGNEFKGVAVAPNGDVYVTRGRQSVPTQENTDALGVNRVMRFGQDAPPAPPSPLTLSPSVKISLGAAFGKKCSLKDPESNKPIKNCTGIREATIEWSGGCPAQGPLTRRNVEISLGSYDPISPDIIRPVTNSASDSGSFKVVLWPGSKVTPKINATCVAFTQPDGEPVTAKASANGNTITTAPVAYTGYMEYSRSPKGVLLGLFRGKKVKGAIRRGREVRLFWAAGYDASLKKGNKSVQVHIRGAGLKVDDYLHGYQLEDAGLRLLIKPRKAGRLKVWVTVGGVRSVNTVTLRVT
jgi:streptogramin lyase